jgi:hypothetical protein
VLDEFDAGALEGTLMLADHIAFDEQARDDIELAEAREGGGVFDRRRGIVRGSGRHV